MRKVLFLVILAAFSGCKLNLLSLTATSPSGRYSLDINRSAESIKSMALADAQKIPGTLESVFGWGGLQTIAKGTWTRQDEKLLLTTLQEDGRQQQSPKVDEAIYKGNEIYLTNKGSELNNAFVLTSGAS